MLSYYMDAQVSTDSLPGCIKTAKNKKRGCIFYRNGLYCYSHQYRGVEQLVARRAHNPEVAGSSPVPATNVKRSLFVNG